jgi:hypothetical protein
MKAQILQQHHVTVAQAPGHGFDCRPNAVRRKTDRLAEKFRQPLATG